MTDVILNTLDADHPLRNCPLIAIGAEYARRGNKEAQWKRIGASWKISGASFNDLAPDVWIEGYDWRACMDEKTAAGAMDVISLMIVELSAAEAKHPGWPADLIHAVGIITEEVGEAMRDAIDLTYWKYSHTPGAGGEDEYRASRLNDLRGELAQVGAMAIRALMNLPSSIVSPETERQ